MLQLGENRGLLILSKLEQHILVSGSEGLEMVRESRFGLMELAMKVILTSNIFKLRKFL